MLSWAALIKVFFLIWGDNSHTGLLRKIIHAHFGKLNEEQEQTSYNPTNYICTLMHVVFIDFVVVFFY